jgi:hypothetical protein
MRRAVRELKSMTKGTSVHVAKNDIKKGLVKVSEHVAQMAYDVAVDAGAEQSDLDRAATKMRYAEINQSRKKWNRAIKNNRRSWVSSVQHLLPE